MTNVMEPHGTDDRRTDSHRDRQEDTCTVVLTRGSSQGFGFSLTGSDPVVISRVEKGSAADIGGLRVGDSIVKVNGLNLSRSSKQTVAKVIKNCSRHMILDVIPCDTRQCSMNQSPMHVPKAVYGSTVECEAERGILKHRNKEMEYKDRHKNLKVYKDCTGYYQSNQNICHEKSQNIAEMKSSEKNRLTPSQVDMSDDKENYGSATCTVKRNYVFSPANGYALYSPQKCSFSQEYREPKGCTSNEYAKPKRKTSPSCVSHCMTPMEEPYYQTLSDNITPKRSGLSSPKQRKLKLNDTALDHKISATCNTKVFRKPKPLDSMPLLPVCSQQTNVIINEESGKTYPVNPIDISAIIDPDCGNIYEEIGGGDESFSNSPGSLLNTAIWSPHTDSSSEQDDSADDMLMPHCKRNILSSIMDKAHAAHNVISEDMGSHSISKRAPTSDNCVRQCDVTVSLGVNTREAIDCEKEYISDMLTGIHKYSRPLRHCILTPKQHRLLFQNVEKLCVISEYNLKLLQDCFGYDPEHIYQSKMQVICEAYGNYISGLSEALNMLTTLKGITEFRCFLQKSSQGQGHVLDLEDFLYRPVIHLRQLSKIAPNTFSSTVLLSQGLDLVAQALQSVKCFQGTKSGSINTSSGVHSLSSSSTSSCHVGQALSHLYRTPSPSCPIQNVSPMMSSCQRMASANPSVCNQHGTYMKGKTQSSHNSHSSITSKKTWSTPSHETYQSRRSRSSVCSSCSQCTAGSVDAEVLRIQNKLVYPNHIQGLALALPGRHLIYAGQLLLADCCNCWQPIRMYLFNDLALVAKLDKTGSFVEVARDPIDLHYVTYLPSSSHPSQFCLSVTVDTCISSAKDLHLRCCSIEDMCTWRNLLEHRISVCQTLRDTSAPD